MAQFTPRQTREPLTSQSGLALVESLLTPASMENPPNHLPTPKERGFTMTNSEIVLSMLGLLVQAKPDFEAIEPFR